MKLILVMLNDLNENFHANVGNGNGFLWESQIPNKFPKKILFTKLRWNNHRKHQKMELCVSIRCWA